MPPLADGLVHPGFVSDRPAVNGPLQGQMSFNVHCRQNEDREGLALHGHVTDRSGSTAQEAHRFGCAAMGTVAYRGRGRS